MQKRKVEVLQKVFPSLSNPCVAFCIWAMAMYSDCFIIVFVKLNY